ncbi:hypothetical protein BDN70DRAFT_873634 [Pholiota conissans]|uniref:BTB domain-containing protein n=1 Tax=Pholiota conissans TaxID=109636 RepID=A0A9P6D4J5_9AGAR|nr:hypothetical protein BDN70DRAFT_873634 [Pholiota conissans]
MEYLEPPRKRKRNDIVDGEVHETRGRITPEKPIVRDEMFYKEDGDCVIRVGAVLFKIHRNLLNRDASAFSDMFSLPQGNERTQGDADENPLVLYDDVDDFRALCWIIYALPTVYMEQYQAHTANIQNLISLNLIAQKYHFEAHEKFTRELLCKHCHTFVDSPGKFRRDNYLRICPESRLNFLLRIFSMTDPTTSKASSLTLALSNVWHLRLEKQGEPVSLALEVGESLGLRDFVAKLYYLQLSRMDWMPLENSIAFAHPATGLSQRQEVILFRGSFSLIFWWSRMRLKIAQKKFECPSFHGCQKAWEQSWDFWISPELEFDNFNPIDVMETIEEAVSDSHYAGITLCAINAIQEMQSDLIDSLADHFLGPLPSVDPAA